MPATWWVNQGQTSRLGHSYEVVWAPLLAEKGKHVASWDRMEHADRGDMVLHYANGFVRGMSIVLSPARPDIRPYQTGSWTNEGRILDVDFTPFDVPVPLGGVPFGLRLGQPRPHSAFDSHGRVNQGYFYGVSTELAQETLAVINVKLEVAASPTGDVFRINGSSDREGIRTYRAEQPELRKRLLAGRAANECALCGVLMPNTYLVAAHIKKRELCSESERADINVAMLACLFGCDGAFERGDLTVNDRGEIEVNAAQPLVRERLLHLHGRRTSAHAKANRRYFRAHRARYASLATAE